MEVYVSLGKLDEICSYFNDYRGRITPFYTYNIAHEFYRGYVVEVYSMKNKSLLTPVVHIIRIPPYNTRWFATEYVNGGLIAR